MGLLDELLSSVVAGQATSGQQRGGVTQAPAQSSGTDMSRILMALLPVVLAMMAQRGGGSQPGRGAGPGGELGGLGGLLGSLLGGGGGGGGRGGGGLGDLLSQFQRAGLGAQAQSWVGRGQNEPLSPDSLEKVFGRDALARIARHAGVSESEASQGLSQLLPEVVDRVTPEGRVPESNELLAGVEEFARRYGVS